MSNWLSVLAQQCQKSSQSRVAKRLNVSTTVINQVLKDKYPSPTDRIQALVEGAYLNRTVQCPVLGALAADKCEHNQQQKFAPVNPIRVQLYRECHGACPNSRVKEEESA
jgi:transcriptional regulator with XRE-family HTH domain